MKGLKIKTINALIYKLRAPPESPYLIDIDKVPQFILICMESIIGSQVFRTGGSILCVNNGGRSNSFCYLLIGAIKFMCSVNEECGCARYDV